METAERNVKANVRMLRTQRGWTLAELSERLEAIGHPLSVKVLNKLESFEPPHSRGVSVDDFVALTKVFDVMSVDLLLPSALTIDVTVAAERVASCCSKVAAQRSELNRAQIALIAAQEVLGNQLNELEQGLDELSALTAHEHSFEDLAGLLREQWDEWTGNLVASAADVLREGHEDLRTLGPASVETAEGMADGASD